MNSYAQKILESSSLINQWTDKDTNFQAFSVESESLGCYLEDYSIPSLIIVGENGSVAGKVFEIFNSEQMFNIDRIRLEYLIKNSPGPVKEFARKNNLL